MVFHGASVEEARKQLSAKYLHFKWTKAGVQDFVLDVYDMRNKDQPIGFEHWLRSEYRAQRLDRFWQSNATPKEAADQLRALTEAQSLESLGQNAGPRSE